MLPKAPDAELQKGPNPLFEGFHNYQMIHIEAYVVHVDMVHMHEVAFKLTPETIEDLTRYHKDIYSVDVSANTWDWPEKESQVKKLQEEFVQAVNKFVFRAPARALEGMEEDGAGELLEGRSEDAKNAILGLFLPLLPPPPRIVDVVHPALLMPSVVDAGHLYMPSQHLQIPRAGSVDGWKVLPSAPSPTMTSCSAEQNPRSTSYWNSVGMEQLQLPSPTPSCNQPYRPQNQLYCSSPGPTMVPSLALPSILTSQCGADAMDHGFGWGYSNFAPQYAITS